MASSESAVSTKTWDFAKFLEVTIDRPAKAVWPYLFREKSDVWSKTKYNSVAGERGQLGELYEMDYRDGYLGFETLHMQLEKHLVLKITYRPRGRDAALSGYDLFTLQESAGRTTLLVQQAFALPVDATADFTQLSEEHDKFLREIFNGLKEMVEADNA